MSLDAVPQSQVFEVVEKPHYSMATFGAAYFSAEMNQALLFDLNCITV